MIEFSEGENAIFCENKDRGDIFEHLFTDYLNQESSYRATWIPGSRSRFISEDYVDPGDIIIADQDGVLPDRVIDIKEARQWYGSILWPWPDICLIRSGEIRLDFLYVVISTNMTHYCFIDPTIVPKGEYVTKSTRRPTHEKATTSTGMPKKYGIIRPFKDSFDVSPYRLAASRLESDNLFRR